MLYYGADYYPEHWPSERWPVDARLMQEAGFNVVRMGEFAWSRFEPAPGRFDLAWLDRAIELLGAHGIQTIVGTPTASPPPWLMALHPDAYRVAEDGRRVTFGNRQEHCQANRAYREHTRTIVAALAEHYAGNPNVLGWQIDNELGARCYCDVCAGRFRDWLAARYGTLQALNQAWGTIFWSHVYTDWRQIPLPLKSGGSPNPGLALDYRRFASDLNVEYLKLQVAEIRRFDSRRPITHNLMGFGYEDLNYFDLAAPLDLVSWDNYPRGFWSPAEVVDPAGPALGHDAMRGLKQQSFWVMEEQSGPSGWETVSPSPRPGEIRLWAYQALAHGADGILYFRWRSCRSGTEQYWHGILDHDGRPRRRYEEVRRMGSELARLGLQVAGSAVRAEVALVSSYDSRWGLQVQPNHPDFRYAGHVLELYRALQRRNVPVDVVSPAADLSRYRLVVAPALYVLSHAEAANLAGFVEQGGTLLVTPRSGVKEANNTVVDRPLPGLLASVCGVEVQEYDPLAPSATRPVAFAWPLPEGTPPPEAAIWCDVLLPRGAEVVARYAGGYYAGEPAITHHASGRGHAVYLGALGGSSLLQPLVDWLLGQAGVTPLLETPPLVEATARYAGDRRLLFLLNHADAPQAVALDRDYQELLGGRTVSGTLLIPPREVAILA